MYVKFNEDGTYGFYTPDIHGEEIIEDTEYYKISDELYNTILENQGLKKLTQDLELVDIELVPEEESDLPESVVYGKQVKIMNAMLAQDLPDENKLKVPLLFETFDALLGETVQKGFVFRHNDVLYRVEQPELTFVEHYSPEQEGLDALFTKLQEEQVTGDIIDWFPPTSTNYYKLGDLMRFTDGLVYESIYKSSDGSDANVWSPVQYPAGWKRRPDLD